MKKITNSSPAKINLTLDIFSKKKEDLYHPLRTILHKISLADEITIEENYQFEIIGDFNFPTEQNLIFKAFRLIKKFFPESPNVKVIIKKRIPEQAGLGGGSSNFAYFIQLYFKLFELGNVPPKIITESGNFGKDIPFFFEQKNCAIGLNLGENIQPVKFADNFAEQTIYLYQPPFGNSTAEAFAQIKQLGTNFTQHFLQSPKLTNCGNSFNQLFKTAKYASILENIDLTKINMTGSGSCFYSFEKINIPSCKIIKTKLL